MNRNTVLAVLTVLVSVNGVAGEILLSASVQWIPVNQTKIRFTYHIGWEQTPVKLCPVPNTALRCAAYLDGTFHVTFKLLGKWIGGYNWTCDSGCAVKRPVADLSGLFYTNISTFRNTAWESGTESVDIDFRDVHERDTISLRFYRPDGTAIAGIGPVRFSMAVRQDTKRPNIGPLISPLPFYRIPLGQDYLIQLSPYDGDGDQVRCKWNRNISSPSLQLNQDRCTIQISTKTHGEFRIGQRIGLSLYAEDYKCSPIRLGGDNGNLTTGPFSRSPFLESLLYTSIPLRRSVSAWISLCRPCRMILSKHFAEITIIIGEPAAQTNTATFVSTGDILHMQNPVSLLGLPISNYKAHFQVDNGYRREYLSTGPRFMNFRGNKAGTAVEAVWNVAKDSNMSGIHQSCVMFYDENGSPYAEPQCQIYIVGGVDECRNNPCQGRELCKSWYNYRTCTAAESTDSCVNNDEDEYDFLKKYLTYFIYAGSGIGGLLLSMLAVCLCLRCCCAPGNRKKSKKTQPETRRDRPPSSPSSVW